MVNDIPVAWQDHPTEYMKLVSFNPHQQKSLLDESENIILIAKEQPTIEFVIEDTCNVTTIKACLAFLLKEGLISITNNTAFENKWNMDIDTLYNKFKSESDQVKNFG